MIIELHKKCWRLTHVAVAPREWPMPINWDCGVFNSSSSIIWWISEAWSCQLTMSAKKMTFNRHEQQRPLHTLCINCMSYMFQEDDRHSSALSRLGFGHPRHKIQNWCLGSSGFGAVSQLYASMDGASPCGSRLHGTKGYWLSLQLLQPWPGTNVARWPAWALSRSK